MRLSVFTDTDWLYPDSPHSATRAIEMHAVRGGHCGAQILGEIVASEGASVSFRWDRSAAPQARLFQLLPVGVNENTSPIPTRIAASKARRPASTSLSTASQRAAIICSMSAPTPEETSLRHRRRFWRRSETGCGKTARASMAVAPLPWARHPLAAARAAREIRSIFTSWSSR